jgi:3-oxoacyl-[acyl-carrier protein] reductase
MALRLNYPDRGAALVFGGSGGAGSSVCACLAETGIDFAFTYLTNEAAAEKVASDAAVIGRRATPHRLDLRDASATRRVADSVAAEFGRIHTVIYASGPVVDLKPLGDIEPQHFREFLDADLQAFFNLTHATLPHLRISGGSYVACVTMAIRRVVQRDTLSAVPKSGVEMLVRQIASEEGRRGVRANAVGLGWIDAGVGARASQTGSLVEEFGADEIAFWMKHSALGRVGSGRELAQVILFLASNEASFVTGQTLMMDGGMTL